MEELLYRYNPWWEGNFVLQDIKERKILERMKRAFSTKDIVFLTGLRRVGKTTLMKSMIHFLIQEKNIDSKRIFYVSLDDYTLSKISLIDLLDTVRKLHRMSFDDKLFLFLDEVTYQKDFEQQLKNLYDLHQVKIYASSSSASLLRNRKPFLTGRYQLMEVLPLDFQEFLLFRGVQVKKRDRKILEGYFEEFLQTGGIPEFVLRGDIEYLKELVDDILLKDIAAVHQIRHPEILKDFFLLLMERAGKKLSINKIAHILSIAPDTAKRYLQMFEESYLIYLIPRCGKTNERILSAKKIYAADLGIRTLFTGFRDTGAIFENYIYLKIKDRHPCYLYRDKIEIDFFTKDKTLIEAKYQAEMNDQQKALFDKTSAAHKLLIRSVFDAEQL